MNDLVGFKNTHRRVRLQTCAARPHLRLDEEDWPMLRTGLKFLIKDAIRGARHTVRQVSRGSAPLDFPGRSELTGLADTMLTSIEETVVAWRYGSDQTEDMIREALGGYEGLRTLIGKAGFEDRFASRTYRLAKGILLRRGLDGVYLSEFAYARAGKMINRQLSLETVGGAARDVSAARFAAVVTLALVETVPVVVSTDATPPTTDPFRTQTNLACASATGLAIAAYVSRSGLNAVECVDSAGDLAVAAFPRIQRALATDEPVAALAMIFAELAPFVP